MCHNSNYFPELPLDSLQAEVRNDAYSLQSDLMEAAEAILQIQFMYELSAADVRNSCGLAIHLLEI